jgi:hypothetical protein
MTNSKTLSQSSNDVVAALETLKVAILEFEKTVDNKRPNETLNLITAIDEDVQKYALAAKLFDILGALGGCRS